MSIFNVLIFSLAVLPFGVRALAEAKIAIGRLKVSVTMFNVIVNAQMKTSCKTSEDCVGVNS